MVVVKIAVFTVCVCVVVGGGWVYMVCRWWAFDDVSYHKYVTFKVQKKNNLNWKWWHVLTPVTRILLYIVSCGTGNVYFAYSKIYYGVDFNLWILEDMFKGLLLKCSRYGFGEKKN